MPAVRLTSLAQQDLSDIWLFIAEDSIRNADRYITLLHSKAQLLADSPGIGPMRPELGENVQSYPWNNYVLFYRRITDGIELPRVLHGARDIEGIFSEQ